LATLNPDDATPTVVIIGHKIRGGCEQAYERWQRDMNREAAKYPGFLAAEINPPSSVQPEWVVIYRFDSVAHVQAWLNSASRQDRLVSGEQYFDGPGTQQVLGGGSQPKDPLVTVAVSHRVSPENVDEFIAWQDRLRRAESKLPGYRGSELFRPIKGIQDEWTALYRYGSAADLEAWLVSEERKQLLEEGAKFADFHSRTIDNSFGSWFAFDAHGEPASPPSDIKTSLAVWFGLYPTVMVLTLLLLPMHFPLWLNLLIGNLLSSVTMTLVTMPFYVNRLLKDWLHPQLKPPRPQANWRGVAIILGGLGFWTVVFYLTTRVFWQLP
jgi:antibiotic biosynthesis monooxygenase (ABM) superfamily enzyme